MRKESLEKLLADLHGVALKYMDECIGIVYGEDVAWRRRDARRDGRHA